MKLRDTSFQSNFPNALGTSVQLTRGFLAEKSIPFETQSNLLLNTAFNFV